MLESQKNSNVEFKRADNSHFVSSNSNISWKQDSGHKIMTTIAKSGLFLVTIYYISKQVMSFISLLCLAWQTDK